MKPAMGRVIDYRGVRHVGRCRVDPFRYVPCLHEAAARLKAATAAAVIDSRLQQCNTGDVAAL